MNISPKAFYIRSIVLCFSVFLKIFITYFVMYLPVMVN